MLEFERVVDALRRHGFAHVKSRLEMRVQSECDGGAAQARLVADGRCLWKTCSDLLAAYEDRGRRLRDALLDGRAEGRRSEDGRVATLVKENSRLEAELKALRQKLADDGSRGVAAGAKAASEGGGALVIENDREVAELTARLRASEATARARERELERLRARLEQWVEDRTRRAQEEKAAVPGKHQRRGGGSALHVRPEDIQRETLLALRSRLEASQAEAASLTKQVHVLIFQVEDAEEKIRKLEGQQQFQVSASMRLAPSSSSEKLMAAEAEMLRATNAKEKDLRQALEEQNMQERLVLHEELNATKASLAEMSKHAERLQAEKHAWDKQRQLQPSASELRWQREALRLRGELVEARRAWRKAEPRSLMREDRELHKLGLNPKELEEGASKACLVAALAGACRLLKVRHVSDLVPAVSALQDGEGRRSHLDKFVAVAVDLMGSGPRGDIQDTIEDIKSRQDVQSMPKELADALGTMCDLYAKLGLQPGAAHGPGNRIEEDLQHARVSREALRTIATELRLPEDAAASECVKRVEGLRIGVAVLEGVQAQLRRKSVHEIPQAVEALLKLCDEHVAAQRIVEALQKLLRVQSLTEVLPALKEVLDVAALRRRAAAVPSPASTHRVGARATDR